MSLPTPSAHLAVPPPPFPPSYAARPFILVPLYIYPAPDAWDPIYTAAALLADALDFYVVVNPGNGPGPDVLPDANYLVALERLTALGNVKVIGYVHCTYGTRDADEIVRDVERYAAWEGESVKAGAMVSLTFLLLQLPRWTGWGKDEMEGPVQSKFHGC